MKIMQPSVIFQNKSGRPERARNRREYCRRFPARTSLLVLFQLLHTWAEEKGTNPASLAALENGGNISAVSHPGIPSGGPCRGAMVGAVARATPDGRDEHGRMYPKKVCARRFARQ